MAVLTDDAGATLVGDELGPATGDLPLLVSPDPRAALALLRQARHSVVQ